MSLETLLNITATRNFLQDGDIYDALIDAAEKYQISEERVEELLDVTDAVLDEQVPLTEMPALLQEAFGLSEEKAREFAGEVASIRLLPLEEFFPGVKEQVKAWGVDTTKERKGPRVEKEAITAEALAEKVTAQVDLSFSELLIKRLAFLLEQRANGQKTDESLRVFFGRSLTIGGLGLAKEQIDALMEAVKNALPGIRVVSEEEYQVKQDEKGKGAVSVPEQAFEKQDPQKNTPHSTPHTPPPTLPAIPPPHDLAAEVPVISSPFHPTPHTLHPTPPLLNEKPDAQAKKKAEKAKRLQDTAIKTAFTEAIDLALAKAKPVLEELNIPSATFADISGKMLRGIRDQYQTRNILEREYQGKGEQLSVLMQALLEGEEAYRVAVDALKTVKEVSVEISEEDAKNLEEQEAKKTEEKFAALTKQSQKPAQAVVELTVGTVVPQKDGSSPQKVTDVVPGKKLMGPVDQLGTMTLADFRRLSTNPEEAVRKMEALLQALQKTSFEDRIRGILAWRKSPLAKLYVTLMTESLNTSVAVAEVAAERRAEGKESLGPAEMHALAKWNEKTRF